jgi:hypothetical protein
VESAQKKKARYKKIPPNSTNSWMAFRLRLGPVTSLVFVSPSRTINQRILCRFSRR